MLEIQAQFLGGVGMISDGENVIVLVTAGAVTGVIALTNATGTTVGLAAPVQAVITEVSL